MHKYFTTRILNLLKNILSSTPAQFLGMYSFSQRYNFNRNIFLFIQNSEMLRNILETDQPYYLTYILDTFLKSNWQLLVLFLTSDL